MRNKSKVFFPLIILLLLLGAAAPLFAQAEATLTIRLRRDFGAGLTSGIQGRFSIIAEGSAQISQVAFYIDETLIGTDSESPFQLQFHTDNFEPGVHTITAVGTTASGVEIPANTIQRNFLSSSEANRAVLGIIVPILVLSIGGSLLAGWWANRNKKGGGAAPAVDGPFGGTICPVCARPYALHFWKLNLGVGALDRCPHCGKWRLVRRRSAAELQAAAAEMAPEEPAPKKTDDGDDLRKRLDDSRFDA